MKMARSGSPCLGVNHLDSVHRCLHAHAVEVSRVIYWIYSVRQISLLLLSFQYGYAQSYPFPTAQTWLFEETLGARIAAIPRWRPFSVQRCDQTNTSSDKWRLLLMLHGESSRVILSELSCRHMFLEHRMLPSIEQRRGTFFRIAAR
jgi:hypothetical protein